MAYLSPTYLKRYDVNNLSNRRYITEAKETSAKANVFLCHSTSDDEHIDRVRLFFREFGSFVYADDYDKSLPDPPTVATAATLKARIADSGRFVVLVSPNSRGSRWIPWEIGVADGKKGVAPVAILPITTNGSEESWTVEHYFGLYPRIRLYDDGWCVLDPRDNKRWDLEHWLQGIIE
jgi:hypothetical protein